MTDISREEALAHFGVKGMRWGVVKEDDLVGGSSKNEPENSDAAKKNALTKEYMAIKPPKVSDSEDARMRAESQAKFKAKFDLPNNEPGSITKTKSWRPTKKQVAYTAVGVAAVGLLIYGNKQLAKNPNIVNSVKKFALHEPGSKISVSDYLMSVAKSSDASWGAAGYIQPASFLRPEMTIPSGQVFHRLSGKPGTVFHPATYCVSSVQDYHRYVAAFRQELNTPNPYHITWKSTKEIKIPDLVTALETLRESMGPGTSAKQAHEQYNSFSGGGWATDGAVRFFDALRKKGFGGIIDEMDAGVIGESPLVLFDRKSMTKKVSSLLTDADIDLSESSLTEILYRKS